MIQKMTLILMCLICQNIGIAQVMIKPKEGYAEDFVKQIENSHNAASFRKHKAIVFDIEVKWGGKVILQATQTAMTNSGKVKMVTNNGATIIFDGKDVYLSTDPPQYKRARFDVLTWHYFFFAPFKLRDKGVFIQQDFDRQSEGLPYNTAKMTFAAGTGDSPNDWYMLYKDLKTNTLAGMAYIVTYGDKTPSEVTPHAITYQDWTKVNGVSFPTKWHFTDWTLEKGFSKINGEATIKNIRWVDNVKGVFDIPKGSTKIDK